MNKLLILHQTHQQLKNKNNRKEMNGQLRKMEKSHN